MEFSLLPEPLDDAVTFRQYRLGKLVEEFIFYALKKTPSVSWICDNLQIQQNQRTVGEFDALFYYESRPVHLEIAYKFYLYDTRETYREPLAQWIGPNRKDRLAQKLDKLHHKQFPLLHSELAGQYLERYGLTSESMQQMLCFKAQLFLPFQNQELDISPLNRDCIAGVYLTFSEMQPFRTCAFFIPQKQDWLIAPHHDIGWINYADARKVIKAAIEKKRSPLVWIKQDDGAILKCFVVFW
ncbi:MAG: DUF1853 family protein [Phaeodactylibacter sp.]|uniref:DUF1853 family protein n=1 Tax=Phaeodactylibacter sp. TaxID=1940289 RepID=UPI0032EE905F